MNKNSIFDKKYHHKRDKTSTPNLSHLKGSSILIMDRPASSDCIDKMEVLGHKLLCMVKIKTTLFLKVTSYLQESKMIPVMTFVGKIPPKRYLL